MIFGKEFWNKSSVRNNNDKDVYEKLSWLTGYWTFDLYEMDARRILKIEELSGREYGIKVAERLVRVLKQLKLESKANFKNTGNDNYMGEPHNMTEEELYKKYQPGQIIPGYSGVKPEGYEYSQGLF